MVVVAVVVVVVVVVVCKGRNMSTLKLKTPGTH